jgi:DNA-binding PadR family transcriptional regulator
MFEDNDEIKIQNLTKLYCLVLLKSKESISGYYILKKLKSDLGKTASPTDIYDFLKKLKAEGYLDEIYHPKSKRSKGFKLTPSGGAFVERILSRFNNLIEVAIESKLKICASCGVKLYGNYYTETIHSKDMNFCCIHCAKAYKDLQHSE